MSSKCKVAVVQFTATNNKTNNLNIVSNLIKDAAGKNAKVCIHTVSGIVKFQQ